jgi:tetratricopeptide (TPR) repeat protein
MSPSFLVTVLAAGLLLPPAFGQARGGGTSPGGGTPGGSIGSTNSGTTGTRSTNPSPTNTNTTSTMPSPIFLSGRVLLEDGTAPPSGVVIERVCDGRAHAEGYADNQGNFSIQLFQPNNGVMQDADETGGMRAGGGTGGMGGASPAGSASSTYAQDRALMGCELRAKLGGYRSQTVNLSGHRAMDPPDIGTILLHRAAGTEEGTTVSAVSLAAPKDARKAFEKGEEALKKQKADDARRDFEKAVAVYPRYAAAWCELGKLQMASDAESAHKSFQSAVDADPKFVTPYVELAILEVKAEKWQSVADLTRKATLLDAFDFPQAFYFNAVANFYLKNLEDAEKSAHEAARLDTRRQYPGDLHLLGLILAQRHDYAGAAEQLRNYLKIAPTAEDAESARSQLAQMEQLAAQAKQ